jgi:glycosyltransferase involved in cell wall biosynthesis
MAFLLIEMTPMNILMVHNYYQQRGGEDESTEQEIDLLQQHGHTVHFFSRHNNEINSYSPVQKTLLFFEPTWSNTTYRQIKDILLSLEIDVVHIQNFFALVSPAVFYACNELNIKAICMLHNYRLLCPGSTFFRDGHICEDCLGGTLWSGIKHKCYHESAIQSAAIALMLKTHRFTKTWTDKIDAYITLSEFARQKFIEGGLPKSKLFVRPNFLVEDPGIGENNREYALYVGRLSPEKGIMTMIEAWKNHPGIPLKIIGDGPQRPQIEEIIRQNQLNHIELSGFLPLNDVYQALRKALFLVMPSIWLETFGRVIIEAYATGTPVIASRIGAMKEIIIEKKTGLLFEPGNALDLSDQIQYAIDHPLELRTWGEQARSQYVQKYTADSAYEKLISIYEEVLEGA